MIPTPAELQGHLAGLAIADPEATAVAFAASPGWKGPEVLEVAGQAFRVVEARSVLEMRQHLEEAEARQERLVCLTLLSERDLGLEVLARLARRRVHPVDAWVAVMALFRAREVDPWLRRHRHLAARLLDYAPPSGYPPAPGGILSADVAWGHLVRQAFGLPREDVRDLLAWTLQEAAARYLGAAADLRQSARQRLERTCGPVAGLVLGCVEAGFAADVVPLGLACRALFPEKGDLEPVQHAAAARMERFTGQVLTPALGLAWARRAQEVFEDLTRADGGSLAARLLRRSDELLEAVGGLDFAPTSALSPAGFQARVRTYASALEVALENPQALPEANAALQRVLEHREAVAPGREVLQMALRLVRWLSTPATPAADPATLARQYRDQGSFVDMARRRLGGGVLVPELDRALARLLERVQARREDENRCFGKALVLAGAAVPQGLLGIESVLDRVVAPLAKGRNRVLLVVLDGASWAVIRELTPALDRLGWTERQPQDGGPLAPVLTVFPSVTETGRTCLLTGSLVAGDQALERRGFREHPGLMEACRADCPPQLLHKADLAGPAQGQLPQDLADRLAGDRHRVLGVVVNAVDDHLGTADQLDFAWSVDTIAPLAWLLGHALRGGRVVVLASDHGHVLERGSDLRSGSEVSADRWRTGSAGPGEEVVQGARVLLGGGTVVVPYSERLRYTQKRAGYHGGATPQEMLPPLLVLAPAGQKVAGWREVPGQRPVWWEEALPRPLDLPQPPPLAAQPEADLPLFGDTTAPSLARVALDSDPVRSRRAALGAEAPDPDQVLGLLETLERAAGPLSRQELGRLLQLPEATLRTLLTRASQLLAWDGRQVLSSTFDGEVVLHPEALQRLAQARAPEPAPGKAAKGTVLEVRTAAGDLVRVKVPPVRLSPSERAVLEALIRHGRMSEAELAKALGIRRPAGLVEALLEKLAGWPGVVPEGEGPEGRIYAFRREAP